MALHVHQNFFEFSDIITDSINDLVACRYWNPVELASDSVRKIPANIKLPSNIPFAQSKEMSVDMIKGKYCKADVFIDYIITVGVEKGGNLQRILVGPCTIMHVVAHNESSDTIVLRQNLIPDDKNEAEGDPEEVKSTLGWKLDRSVI